MLGTRSDRDRADNAPRIALSAVYVSSSDLPKLCAVQLPNLWKWQQLCWCATQAKSSSYNTHRPLAHQLGLAAPTQTASIPAGPPHYARHQSVHVDHARQLLHAVEQQVPAPDGLQVQRVLLVRPLCLNDAANLQHTTRKMPGVGSFTVPHQHTRRVDLWVPRLCPKTPFLLVRLLRLLLAYRNLTLLL